MTERDQATLPQTRRAFLGRTSIGLGSIALASLLNPERAHQGGLAALRQAGGSAVDRQPSTVDIVLDGIVGIGGKGGLRPDARPGLFDIATST